MRLYVAYIYIQSRCVLVGYDDHGMTAISWGRRYTLTWDFVGRIADEAYALVDPAWVAAGGKTPGGLSLGELKSQMNELKK